MAKLWKQEGQNVLLTSGKMTINDLISGPLQFNVQGDSYFNGNVGIGTNGPTAKLDATNNNVVINANRTTTDGAILLLRKDGSIIGHLAAEAGDLEIQSTADISFDVGGSKKMRIDSAGNVGIGTEGPTEKLHLFNSGNLISLLESDLASDVRVRVKNSAGNGDFGYDATGMFIQDNSSNPIRLFTGAAERMRIDSSGNVGIGTPSPTSGLHLSGAATVNSRLTLEQTTAGLTSTLQQGSSGFALSALGIQSITMDTNGVERFKIASDGNVSIGSSTADTTLTVVSSGGGGANPAIISSNTIATFRRTGGLGHQANISILGGSDGGSALNLGDRDLEDVGRINYNHDIDAMTFDTLSAERMRIDSSGNVGIGHTPSGGIRLDVNGAGRYYNASGDTFLINETGITTGTNYLEFKDTGGALGHIRYEHQSNIMVLRANATDVVTLTSTGVGIGTSSPTAKLEVQELGANVITSTFTNGANDSGFKLGFANGSGTALNSEQGRLDFSFSGTSIGSIGFHRGLGADCLAMTFSTSNNDERMRIDNFGNVGIGETSPSARLHVDSGATDLVGLFEGTSNPYIQIKSSARAFNLQSLSNGNFRLQDNTSGQNILFYTQSNGFLGIGTSSPNANLDISSQVPTIHLTDSDNGYYGAINSNSGDLTLHADLGNSNANSTMAFTIDGSEKMRIDSAGNVGIGTAIPLTALDVRGAADTALSDHGFVDFQDSLSRGLTIGYETTNDKAYIYSRQVGVSSKDLNINNMLNIGTGSGVVVGDGAGAVSTAKFAVTDGSTARYHIAPGSTTCVLHARNYANNGYVSAIYGATQHIFEINGVESGRFANGNLGLGETNPTFKLESTQAVDGEHVGLVIHNSQAHAAASLNESAYLLFGLGGDKDVARVGVTKVGDYTTAGNSNSALDFWTDTGGTVSKKMSLRDTGDLQLGFVATSEGIILEPGSVTSTLRYDSDKFRLFAGKAGGYQEEVAVWNDDGFLALTSVGASPITNPIYPLHVRTDSAVHNTHSFVLEIEGTKVSNTAHMLIVQKNADHSYGSCLEVRCDNDTADPTPDRPRIDWVGPTGNSWSWGGRANSTSDSFCLFKDGGASQGVEGSIIMEVNHTTDSVTINGPLKVDTASNSSAGNFTFDLDANSDFVIDWPTLLGGVYSGFKVQGAGSTFFTAESLTGNSRVIVSSTSFAFNGHPTTAAAANCFISSTSGEFARSTSSVKYKKDIRGLTDEEIDLVYKLDPMRYRSKIESDRDVEYFGFTAEHLHDNVDTALVQYSEDEPEGVAYERVTVLLAAEAKRQKERADALEARLEALESHLGL